MSVRHDFRFIPKENIKFNPDELHTDDIILVRQEDLPVVTKIIGNQVWNARPTNKDMMYYEVRKGYGFSSRQLGNA